MEVLILFGMGWKMLRNRCQKTTFQTGTNDLVNVGWEGEYGNKTKLASMFEQCMVCCIIHGSLYVNLIIYCENEHHENEDIGEIDPFIIHVLPYLPPGIDKYRFSGWT